MAIQLKAKLSITNDLKTIQINDVTGAYTPNNTTGYGTPNQNKSALALILLVDKVPYTGNPVPQDIIPDAVSYDPSANNEADSIFKIDYKEDGWYKLMMFGIPTVVSTPEENNIRYNDAQNEVQIYTQAGWNSMELEDLKDHIDNESIYTLEQDEIVIGNLIKQENCLVDNFIGCMDCRDCDCLPKMEQAEKAALYIKVVTYLFKTGKKYEAARRLEGANREFKCCK